MSLLKLALSPPKKKRKDIAKCVVHQRMYDSETAITPFSQTSWNNVKRAGLIRNDHDVLQLVSQLEEASLPDSEYGYHRRCYSNYAHSKTLANIQKRSAQLAEGNREDNASSSNDRAADVHERRMSERRKDRQVGQTLADYECCICRKKKTNPSNSGYEALQRCETENAAKNLQETALEKADNAQLVVNMTGIDWKVIVVVIDPTFQPVRTCSRIHRRECYCKRGGYQYDRNNESLS
eukprot:gene1799-2005_t